MNCFMPAMPRMKAWANATLSALKASTIGVRSLVDAFGSLSPMKLITRGAPLLTPSAFHQQVDCDLGVKVLHSQDAIQQIELVVLAAAPVCEVVAVAAPEVASAVGEIELRNTARAGAAIPDQRTDPGGRATTPPGAALSTAPGSAPSRCEKMSPSHGTNAARTGKFVATGSSGDAMSTYPGPLTIHGSPAVVASVSEKAPAPRVNA